MKLLAWEIKPFKELLLFELSLAVLVYEDVVFVVGLNFFSNLVVEISHYWKKLWGWMCEVAKIRGIGMMRG